MIAAIVEGHAEVESVPVLLRRFLAASEAWQVGITLFRVKRYQVVKDGQLERYVELARRKGARAILVVLDADDDCPKELAPNLLERARQAAGSDVLCSVVLPTRELESWFLASIESLRGQRGIREDVLPPGDPESIRDAKGWLTQAMRERTYVETDDQPALAELFEFEQAASRCRSFRKFEKDVRGMLLELVGGAELLRQER